MKDAIWAIIHKIEETARKDDLSNMPRADLENLVVEIYDELWKIAMN